MKYSFEPIIIIFFLIQDEQPKSNKGRRRKDSSSAGTYTVEYGPIRVRHRLTVSQTLATGRRPKDDPVEGDAAIQREIRRAKNRIAARELKRTRDQIEQDLIEKIKQLEQEQTYLEGQHKELEDYKAQLNRAVYNAKQAPLIPLIADLDTPLLLELQSKHDLLIDLQPLLRTLEDNFGTFDC